MGRNIKKLLAMCMALVLAIGLLTACSQNEGETGTVAPGSGTTGSSDKAQTGNTQTSSSGPEELTLPIVKEPLTLTYFVGLNSNVAATMATYDEAACFEEKEKKTGIHIDFLHPPVGQENEQFNLMMASQDYPDIIEWNWLTVPGGPQKALDDGAIIPLNDLIGKYAPNLQKVLAENPEAKKQIVTDTGTFYAFPFLRIDPYLRVFMGFQLRQDWLDRLNLEIPTTMDEWYNVLTAFKKEDANGNGDPNDEIPTTSMKADRLWQWLYTWGITYDFYRDGNTVKYGPVQPEYKEFLITMNKWYNEGLIDPDFAANDSKQFDAKVTSDKVGAIFGYAGSNMRRYIEMIAPQNPNFKLVATPYPVLKEGDKPKLGQMDNLYPGINGGAITSKNKYQKESAKWLDYNYSEEGHMLFNFGIEGESYVMENGYPKYTEKITKNPNGLPFTQALAQYAQSCYGGVFVQDRRYMEQYMSMPELDNALNLWVQPDHSRLMPPITPTSDESTRLASIMNEINTYRDEMFIKFIMGQESINNFDNYVQNIKNMGIDEAIKIEQTALDRYNAR